MRASSSSLSTRHRDAPLKRLGSRCTLPSLSSSALFLLVCSTAVVRGSPCAAFDESGAAYIFGASYGDLRLGTVDEFAADNVTTLTNKTGRPDFSGSNTQCFTNQFTNGLYVLNAVTGSPENVYIYDFGGQSWSTQPTSGGPNASVAILDHDTNVLFAFADGNVNSLSFNQDSAKSTGETISWTAGASGNEVAFNTTGYQPVMGAANNHIQFLNVPGTSPGQAYIFVIHYAYWQPEVQSFGDFPVAPGQTVTIFSNSSSAPNRFAYIPDGGNETYIINAKTNTTTTFPPPPTTELQARYSASTHILLQLASSGSLSYLDLDAGSEAAWSSVSLPSSILAINGTVSTGNNTAIPANNGNSNRLSGGASSGTTTVPSERKNTGSAALAVSTRHIDLVGLGSLLFGLLVLVAL